MVNEFDALIPDSLRRFIDLAGREATFEFVRQFGGQILRFPSGKTQESKRLRQKLVEIFGAEPYKKILAEYRGAYIEVPLCTQLLRLRARAQMIEDYERHGLSVNEIAAKYRCTARNVKRALKTCTVTPVTLPLFDLRHDDPIHAEKADP